VLIDFRVDIMAMFMYCSFKGINHRKVAEALYIKQIKPQLNKQNYSIPLKLYQ